MTNGERDEMLIEMHTDVKWIKEWIRTQNKYKFAIVIIFITAVIGIIV